MSAYGLCRIGNPFTRTAVPPSDFSTFAAGAGAAAAGFAAPLAAPRTFFDDFLGVGQNLGHLFGKLVLGVDDRSMVGRNA